MLGTGVMIDGLRAEGFEVTPSYVDWLIRDRILIPPAKILGRRLWEDADVRRLRSELIRRGRGPGVEPARGGDWG